MRRLLGLENLVSVKLGRESQGRPDSQEEAQEQKGKQEKMQRGG